MAENLTEEQRKALETDAAKTLLNRMKSHLEAFEGFKTEFDKLKAANEELGKLDVANVVKRVEELYAGQEAMRRSIRTARGGIFVPGLEDTKEEFSLVKTMAAVKMHNWDHAGYEKEVIEAAKKVLDRKTKGTGHIAGNDGQGAFFIPDQVIADVIMPMYAASVLIALDANGTTRVSVMSGLIGQRVTIPKFIGGTVAYWMGEQDKYVESAAKGGNLSMMAKKMGVLIRITDEMQRFGAYGFESLLRADMIRALAALLDYTIMYGTGTDNMPRGIVNASNIKLYSAETHSDTLPSGSWTGAELGYDDLMNMQGLVEDANFPITNWAWISSPRYFRRLRQAKEQNFSGQSSNFGYLVDGPMMTEDRLRGLIGDYAKLTTTPTTNTAGQSAGKTPVDANDKKYTDVVGANMNDIVLGRWGGLEIVDDRGLGKGFPNDETYVKVRSYADVGFRNPESIVLAPDVKVR